MADPDTSQPFYLRPLYKLLDKTFPQYRTGQGLFDVPGFASAIGMSGEGCYKWLRADKLSAEGAKKIIALSAQGTGMPGRALTQEDLCTFVFR